jgi:toxin ParE1/3/4
MMWDYFIQRKEAATDRLTAMILKRARPHAQFPLAGRPRDDLGANVRSFAILPYVVYDRPVDDTSLVLRVRHGARDVDSIMLAEEGNRSTRFSHIECLPASAIMPPKSLATPTRATPWTIISWPNRSNRNTAACS